MKAEVAGSNLYLMVEGDEEISRLVTKHMRLIETRRIRDLPFGKESLSAKLYMCGVGELPGNATLGFVSETKNTDGIDVTFFPEGVPWAKLDTVNVDAAYRLYEQLTIQGLIAACYAGDSVVRIKFGL